MDGWMENKINRWSLAEIVEIKLLSKSQHRYQKTPINNFALVGQAISPKRGRRPSSESVCNVKGLLIQLPTS